jgi:tetratricopeptide (TPR) repeat protein
MYNDDFFEDDFREIDNLLIEFHKIKRGEPHQLLLEEEFEYLIDYFETSNDRENGQLACDISTTLYPFSAALWLRKAEWLYDGKKFGQSLKVLEQIQQIDPNNFEALLLESDIYVEQNRAVEAIALLEGKLSNFEGTEKIELYFELAEIYDEEEDFDKVYTSLRQILQLDPTNEEALMRICFWAELTGKHQDSIELHQAIIEDNPFCATAWYNLGVAFQGINLFEKAVESYEYCIAIDDTYEYAYRNMGDAYIQLKKFDLAIDVLEQHLTLTKPEDIILEALGYCWEKQKEFAKARSYYRQASQLSPKDDQIFYKIGETYTKESQWEKAIKAYSVALHMNKNNVSYCLALGNCLMELNSEKEALVVYLNAVQLRPDIKSTWQALVKALYVAGYLEEALSQLLIAEDHCGNKGEFLYYRAVILLASGKTKEAVLVLEDALTHYPKKHSSIAYMDKDIAHHPVFADVLVQYKKKK